MNLESFPNNFGDLSKFLITSYDSGNSATNTALSNNGTSSDGSGGFNKYHIK